MVRLEGAAKLTARVGEPVTLVATVTDDGVPRARTREEFLATLARRASSSGGFGALLLGGGANRGGASPSSNASPTAGAGPSTNASPGGVPPALAARLFTLPPNRITVGKNLGLHLSWFVYHGAGDVQFEPAQINSQLAPLDNYPALPHR